MSTRLYTRSTVGGADLFHGIPELKGAIITDVRYEPSADDFITCLVLTRTDGSVFEIIIQQQQ